jgi:hypothetical protein
MIISLVWFLLAIPPTLILGYLAYLAWMDRVKTYDDPFSNVLDRRIAHKEWIVWLSTWAVGLSFWLAGAWSFGCYLLEVPADAEWARRVPILLLLFSGLFFKTGFSIYAAVMMRGVRKQARAMAERIIRRESR